MELPSPNVKNTTLNECIKQHMEDELLTDKRCGKCMTTEAYRSTMLKRMPEILSIQFKRFSSDGKWQHKKYTNVDFPMNMNMGMYSESKADCKYELYSVINHYGSLMSGHYTALCRDETETHSWTGHDDHRTSTGIKEHDLEKKDAYILFYRKVHEKERTSDEPVIEETNDPTRRSSRNKPSAKVKDNNEQKRKSEEKEKEDTKTNKSDREEREEMHEKSKENPKPKKRTKEADDKQKNKHTTGCLKCSEPWERLFCIRCDICHSWFHGKCVGVKEGEYEKEDEFRCYTCWKGSTEKSKAEHLKKK